VTPQQWARFKAAAKRQPGAVPPLALIVDSPWIPGDLGLNHLDYFFDPELWFQANLRVSAEFPEAIFLPGWWVEFGMAVEPSAYGARIRFWNDRPPDVSPCLRSIADAAGLAVANPACDGLMPVALRRYQTLRRRIFDAGHTIPFATARGPLCLASFLRGITELMIDLSEHAAEVHALLDVLTRSIIAWLEAQCDAIGASVEGIFLLDDVAGLLSRRAYLEFAHPYIQRIFAAFPKDWVKLYHNDANIKPFAADLPSAGIDVLNWSYRFPYASLAAATQGALCPMGNVAPLELAVNGTPAQVFEAARNLLTQANGEPFILSVGGGVSPGMPRANVQAMIDALREHNGARLATQTA
jgi:uroporphyrinogen decarboxylase